MEDLLSRLQQLNLPHETISHAAVMTVDAQAECLQGQTGSVTKNLFLKDKKGRLFIVTALPDTKVDLKVLSARLGTGKGGLRMAPDELIPSILGVPLGSVTPLAICTPTATDVVLLLDQKIKSQPSIFVHPLDNTASLSISPANLETFLESLGRTAEYVDLEADPQINKDNPPDLKHIADAAKPLVGKEGEGDGVAPAAAQAPSKAAPPAGASKTTKKAAGASKTGGGDALTPAAPRRVDVYAIADSLLAKTAAGFGADASAVDADAYRKLKADVVMELNALRNAAYAAGFTAAQAGVVAALTPQRPC